MKRKSPRVNIDVQQEIIDDAVRGDSGHCMIAEAVKAAYPAASHVSVDLQTIRFTDPEKHERYTYLTPRVAQIALCRFDEGDKTIEPFAFRLQGAQVTNSGARTASYRQQDPETKVRVPAFLQPTDGDETKIPEKIGGTTPPRAALASGGRIRPGKRRQFGLRALESKPGETLRTGTRTGGPGSGNE